MKLPSNFQSFHMAKKKKLYLLLQSKIGFPSFPQLFCSHAKLVITNEGGNEKTR